MVKYYSHGKLLLTGEYVVLDGALSLAIPTKFGQDLTIKPIDEPKLLWKSFDHNKAVWFEEVFRINNNEILKQVQNDYPTSNRLLQILNGAKNLNPDYLSNHDKGYEITTQLEFPKNWGLGTSSTLINNIANWAHVNPYQLLDMTFGGSGYDIACAQAKAPLTYRIKNNEILNQAQSDKKREIKTVDFNPSFKSNLYFVHLNEKQNSRDGIAQYRVNTSDLKHEVESINGITLEMIDCDSLENFQKLMHQHELFISKIIGQKPVKEVLFKDFKGSIKSLGAWGGDFVLVASETNPTTYFKDKGFETILNYDDMVIK
ncbi:GYDIA family GHMP kinase [Psychroserpens mesophilus]|uniref:GYDIA family GHMP kinase n=1 Tax=Psychroserpens mesophilus TaxID=325473 RepID=UPI0005906371|nr:GYDIA family GHMP kinase [Psychroserpens mesophilus]